MLQRHYPVPVVVLRKICKIPLYSCNRLLIRRKTLTSEEEYCTRTPNGHLYRVTYTRCRIDTINSPDDGAHGYPKHVENRNKHIWKQELCIELVIYKDYTEMHGQQNMTFYYINPSKMHMSQFILSDNCSTCFGRHYHPSSGAQNNCNYSIW